MGQTSFVGAGKRTRGREGREEGRGGGGGGEKNKKKKRGRGTKKHREEKYLGTGVRKERKWVMRKKK